MLIKALLYRLFQQLQQLSQLNPILVRVLSVALRHIPSVDQEMENQRAPASLDAL
jgi:hypothetical protein